MNQSNSHQHIVTEYMHWYLEVLCQASAEHKYKEGGPCSQLVEEIKYVQQKLLD